MIYDVTWLLVCVSWYSFSWTLALSNLSLLLVLQIGDHCKNISIWFLVLLQSLVEVITSSDPFISVRATILLGELLHLVSLYCSLNLRSFLRNRILCRYSSKLSKVAVSVKNIKEIQLTERVPVSIFMPWSFSSYLHHTLINCYHGCYEIAESGLRLCYTKTGQAMRCGFYLSRAHHC